MIATINPEAAQTEESLSTCRYRYCGDSHFSTIRYHRKSLDDTIQNDDGAVELMAPFIWVHRSLLNHTGLVLIFVSCMFSTRD
jgi:hypothetical protein